MKHDLPVFALLIDADNVTKEAIAPIIEEVTRHGRIAVRRVYGDFTTPNLASWRETLASHGIHPIQQYQNSVGKNSSDSALIIDAMDLLHSGRFDGFCLVSSDGDFTRLATRIREDGLSVFGFGRKDAAKAFVNACERYIYVENLLNTPEQGKEVTDPTPLKAHLQANTTVGAEPPKTAISKLVPKQPVAKTSSPADTERLKVLLSKAYTNVAEESDWVLVSRLDQYLRANHSDFDPRNYGAGTFPKLLATLDIFEVIQRKQGNGNAQFCRLRPYNSGHGKSTKALPPKIAPSSRMAAHLDALKTAVTTSQAANGWSNIANIRVHLHKNGHHLDESIHSSLESALKAARIFEMRDAGGSTKEFRLGITSH